MTTTPVQSTTFEACLDQAIDVLDDAPVATARASAGARRANAGTLPDASASVTLVDDNGQMRWIYSPVPRRNEGRRAARAGAFLADGVPVRTIPIQDLPANQILQGIAALDRTLTPSQGMRCWRNGVFESAPRPEVPPNKRTLLFVHGTFSKSDMFFEELAATPEGAVYLNNMAQSYDTVLAFDHPTLAVSPWINALDLDAAMSHVQGPIDVVCHSRGGLVTAWWLRLGRRNVERVLFVGSPLAGTSLASPAALRGALDHLATAAQGIVAVGGAVSTVVPFMSVVTGLVKVLGKALQLGADLPIADAAIVTVPGLASQSRVSNNAEMLRLFASPWPSEPQVHAVVGNFKPKETDAGWRFWQRLTNVGDQLKYGALNLIFDGPNDLVVDTLAMSGPADGDTAGEGAAALWRLTIDEARLTPFHNSPTVHHTNYFRQPETIRAMSAFLQ
jgi:pimeloyl-ACP methyl ester carboxylesterase